MQPTIQQSQHVHRRVVSTPHVPPRNPASAAPRPRPHQETIPAAPLPIELARRLLAILPGRAALLDPSGLVIAWNDPSSPAHEYAPPAQHPDIGLLVVPLKDTGGASLVWAPESGTVINDGQKPSRALLASRAQICDLTSRLMRAQEDERKKISRELHDDLGQRLAAHALAIGNLKQNPPTGAAALKERLLSLETEAIELGESIRIVSHELHPALLERLGLAPALLTFASEFCEWAGLRLVPSIPEPPVPIPGIVALAAYRIAQEAIRNIERHAHATTVQLRLRVTERQLHLQIEDDGIGFVSSGPAARKGLGLTSIEERVRMLNGRLSIDGARGRGTAITVHIPLNNTGP